MFFCVRMRFIDQTNEKREWKSLGKGIKRNMTFNYLRLDFSLIVKERKFGRTFKGRFVYSSTTSIEDHERCARQSKGFRPIPIQLFVICRHQNTFKAQTLRSFLSVYSLLLYFLL